MVDVMGATVTSAKNSSADSLVNHNRPFLVKSGKHIPSELTSFHQSTQTCSDSQPLNSPRFTGLRL